MKTEEIPSTIPRPYLEPGESHAEAIERWRKEIQIWSNSRSQTPPPLDDETVRKLADIRWAQEDSEVQLRFAGQLVVVFEKHIIAHGYDTKTVLEKAAGLLNCDVDDLAITWIDDFSDLRG